MPKQTFHNLDPDKKKLITDAFLREFAIKTFDEASITAVVKQLGIAKGSVYQYFDGKLDLLMYLIERCNTVKMGYVASLQRQDYPDFWAYFRDLYVHGLQFDAENPLESHFLHSLTQNLNSPSIREVFERMMQRVVQAFEGMAAYEVEQGLFRKDISLEKLGFLLYKVGLAIQEHLEFSGVIQPRKSIEQQEPVYQGKKDALLRQVDEYIALVRPAFDQQQSI